MKSLSFWKSKWGKDFKIYILIIVPIILISGFFLAYLVMTPNNLPLEYIHLFFVPSTLLIWLIFLIGVSASLSFPYAAKQWLKIFYLNDFNYSKYRTKRGLIFMIFAIAILLGILYLYFYLADYKSDFVKTLLLSWIALIFVRSAYYINPRVGRNLGVIIISSLIPVGLFIAASKIVEFFKNISFDVFQVGLFCLYFIIIITFHIGLEMLMEYVSVQIKETNKRKIQKQLKTNWENDSRFVKYK